MPIDIDKMKRKAPDVERSKKDRARAVDMIEEIGIADIDLNDWENEFIESVGDQIDKGKDLTEAQLYKLEQIWDKI